MLQLQSNAAPRTRVAPPTIDRASLEKELRKNIEGEVRFDDGSRALYATDASNYRQVPIGVVIPTTVDDVIAAVAVARRFGAPILPRGGGTSLAGQTCNVAVVLDFSKYLNNILEIDAQKKLARVQPGIVLDELNKVAKKQKLIFGPDPATHRYCNIGGMIGNNSCGIHSVMAGRTADNVEELEILTYDGARLRAGKTSEQEYDSFAASGGRVGKIYRSLRQLVDENADRIRERYPRIPRRVSGYNLDELLPENGFHLGRALVGSEGTCVVVLEATLKLVHDPPARSLLIFGYPDVFAAADHVMEVLEHKPIGLEGLDERFIIDMKKKHLHPEDLTLMPEGRGFLLVEFGAETKAEADDQARRLMDQFKKHGKTPSMKLFDDPEHEKMVWEIRESGLGATARVPGEAENWEGWEDSAVHPKDVGRYLRDFKALMDRYGYNGSLYGHFGDGCVHTRLNFDLESKDGIAKYHSFVSEAADIIVSYKGSFSGEHGDGQSRAELLPKMYGEELVEAFREFKSIWDPDWKMNPGKVVNAYKNTENLRLGPHYHPWEPDTHFSFPKDRNSFSFAMQRCVGAGLCRKHEKGTMCPSYMVTREEKHSTRGRARLLFEMLQGDPLKDGWRDEHVKDALDLCLSCKGCKGECPVNVDMATYKAEFLSHYYEGRLRPRHAYAFGLIHYWATAGAYIPEIANFATQTPLLSNIAKLAAGMAQQRRIPAFAPQTFKQWWRMHPRPNIGKTPVLLWADTFNNHFYPETATAAVEVLERAGFDVQVKRENLCCGRPLYDYGMLDLAKRFLRKNVRALREEIENGTPIVVLEPSCAAVFRDELTNLLHGDLDAEKLKKQVMLLGEFLKRYAPDFAPPLKREALFHAHCHQKAVLSTNEEVDLLKRMGVKLELPDTGCCGMAGAFGFEPGDHYDVSIKCGERVLLPGVRAAARETLIVADGFSCREQIAQSTSRRALHLAQVLQMALREGPDSLARPLPETAYVRGAARERRSRIRTAAALGIGLMAGLALARLVRKTLWQ